MEWFAKPPRIGKPTPPHQDAFYWQLGPSSALTLWLSLDRIDETNGCIRYIPGSHLLPLRPHNDTNTIGFSMGITDYCEMDIDAESAVVTSPGDLIVHHANVAHRANPNVSAQTRRALGLVYFSGSPRRAHVKSRYPKKQRSFLDAKADEAR